MRIINSTLGAISSLFEAADSAAEIAKQSASKALNALNQENKADQLLAEKRLAAKVNSKQLELDRDAARIAEERIKLQEKESYRAGQIDLINSQIEILEFKEKTPEERIQLLKKKLEELKNPSIATSINEVSMTK